MKTTIFDSARTVNGSASTTLRLVAALWLGLLAGLATAAVSEPDHIIYGQLSWFGEPVHAGEVTISVAAWPEPVAAYELGTDPALGPQYALRIPMDSIGSRMPGTAREGDEAAIFWNGELVAEAVIGERGTARRLDIDSETLGASTGLLIDSIAISEGGAGTQTPATFTVTLTAAVEDQVTFNWVTQDGSAAGGVDCSGGADYVADSGIGQILPGQQQTQLSVMVCGNDEPDGDRDFFVELHNPHNAVLLVPLGQAVIRDTDTPPQAIIHNITVQEPVNGEQIGAFNVSLTEPWDEPVTINWATANGSALAGIDYIADSGVLTIPPGAQVGQIQVTILSNPLNNQDREFFVDLTNPVNATLLHARGQALIVSATQMLAFLETHKDGVSVQGMSDPASVAVASPDGGHVYVASLTADELVVLQRNAGSGGLVPQQMVATTPLLAMAGRQIDGISGFGALAISPDGASVYAVAPANHAVVAFSRNNNPADVDNFGRLSLVEVIFQDDIDPDNPAAGPVSGLRGARGVTVSPDGHNVYVAGATDGTLAVFRRNAVSGALIYSEVERNGVDNPNDPGPEVQGLAGAFDVAVTPDGAFVYATGQSSDAVAVFSRNQTSGLAQGQLNFIRHYVHGIGGVSGMLAPAGLAFSPDGDQLYVVGQESNSVAVFDRAGNGDLTWKQAATAGANGVQGLESPRSIALSHDGALVYVASVQDGNESEPGTLTLLRRNEQPTESGYGMLNFSEVKRNQVGGIHGLWGATSVAVSPDDDHIYVAARWDKSVTVFVRDQSPPVNPDVESTSHEIQQWRNDPVITMQWSGAFDTSGTGIPGGSGIQGYSVLFSQNPASEPNAQIDVAHTVDPHTVQSNPLVDGIAHWFHLRTCDFGGNCSDPVGVGPYWIDTVAPSAPPNVISTTHQPGEPSIPDTVISMQWDAAIDSGTFSSGVAGYSYVFSTDPQLGPNEVVNLGPEVLSVDSEPLTDGAYYFHIAAVDVAGNWGPAVVSGPFGVGSDDAAPTIQQVSSAAAPQTGQIFEGTQFDGAVTQLLVRFSEPMADNAGQIANYRLYPEDGNPAPGCAGAPDGGLIASVAYEPFAHTTRIVTGNSRGLPEGDYVLIVCDAIEDLNGNGLDGNDSGASGGDFVRRFGITRQNLLINPNFDNHIGVWSASSGAISQDGAADADGHATSGAALFDIQVGDPGAHALSQCVSVAENPDATYGLRARVRMEEVGGGDPTPVNGFASLVFYSEANCGEGSELAGAVVSNTVTSTTSGQWVPLSVQATPGTGAASVLISMNLTFPSSTAFPVRAWFDNTLFFAVGGDVSPDQLPRVESVLTTRGYEWDDLSVGLPTERSLTQLIPVFTRQVFTEAGGQHPEGANNPDNYRVLRAGSGGGVQTADCGPVDTADISMAIGGVSYSATDRRAIVALAGPQALSSGQYRLIVCGTIRDFDGNYLDGSGQNQPGSDYVLDFEVATTNLLANPNLDSVTAPWQLQSSPGGSFARGTADVDARLSSGSLRIQHDAGTGETYRASQCVDLQGLHVDLTTEVSVFVNQGAGEPPLLTTRVHYFEEPECDGDELGDFEVADIMGHTGGVWRDLIHRIPEAPFGAQSARVVYEVESDADIDAPFTLWLDHLMLRSGNANLIFRNRFTIEP